MDSTFDFQFVPVSLSTDSKRIVVHHLDNDGYMAAGIAASSFGGNIQSFPTTYGRPFPFNPNDLTTDHSLYILDFSYSAEILEQLAKHVGKLVVLDHHEGMRDQIAHLPYVTFDTNFSGAGLAWRHFVGEEIPFTEAVDLVDAYDLWDKQRSTCSWEIILQYHLATEEHQTSIDFWANAAAQLFVPQELMTVGKSRMEELKILIEAYSNTAHVERVGGVYVAMFPTPSKWVSLVHDGVKECIGADMSISYSEPKEKDHITLNFRSSATSAVSALQVAKKLGGGGHIQAAGCRIPDDQDPEALVLITLREIQGD